ncbi:hypothetical protein P7K49_008441, partial [Saguinus oedipus]
SLESEHQDSHGLVADTRQKELKILPLDLDLWVKGQGCMGLVMTKEVLLGLTVMKAWNHEKSQDPTGGQQSVASDFLWAQCSEPATATQPLSVLGISDKI